MNHCFRNSACDFLGKYKNKGIKFLVNSLENNVIHYMLMSYGRKHLSLPLIIFVRVRQTKTYHSNPKSIWLNA